MRSSLKRVVRVMTDVGGGITTSLNCTDFVLASSGTGRKTGVCVSMGKVMHVLVDEVDSLEVKVG